MDIDFQSVFSCLLGLRHLDGNLYTETVEFSPQYIVYLTAVGRLL